MGADLYINSIFSKNKEKFEPEFDKWVEKRNKAQSKEEKDKCQEKVVKFYDKMNKIGYFRDSYNNSNLLWMLNLDYWSWFKSFLDKNNRLSPKKAKILVKELKERKIVFDNKKELLKKDWVDYFEKSFKELTEFLETAIDLNESIECSI